MLHYSQSVLVNLKDRTRLLEENALTICNYIIAFKHEVNPRPSYIKYIIQFLSELSKAVGIGGSAATTSKGYLN